MACRSRRGCSRPPPASGNQAFALYRLNFLFPLLAVLTAFLTFVAAMFLAPLAFVGARGVSGSVILLLAGTIAFVCAAPIVMKLSNVMPQVAPAGLFGARAIIATAGQVALLLGNVGIVGWVWERVLVPAMHVPMLTGEAPAPSHTIEVLLQIAKPLLVCGFCVVFALSPSARRQ